jgi:hypothetical protein
MSKFFIPFLSFCLDVFVPLIFLMNLLVLRLKD